MSDLVKKLRSLANCDARAGEPLGKCMREAADRITALEAERDRLLKLVKDAYNEGFMQGMREHTSRRGGIPWNDSAIRAALSPTPER